MYIHTVDTPAFGISVNYNVFDTHTLGHNVKSYAFDTHVKKNVCFHNRPTPRNPQRQRAHGSNSLSYPRQKQPYHTYPYWGNNRHRVFEIFPLQSA